MKEKVKSRVKKYRSIGKVRLIPTKNIVEKHTLRKPKWIRVKLLAQSTARIETIKSIMRKYGLHSVCEEAACPNLPECFGRGTATFMILGDICTRRCSFCNVSYGRPDKLDEQAPHRLADAIADMNLKYVVVTSVNRDDLRDGGAQHFSKCINEIYKKNPLTKVEILVPDFRGCMDNALKNLGKHLPHVFNHNLESVPRLYPQVRPGANYKGSLTLLKKFKKFYPQIPTKSGLMLGLGETIEEIFKVMYDLRANGVTMLTLGQYLQPSPYHFPVQRYISPKEFQDIKLKALDMGFRQASCGPLVRSSYHADLQAEGKYI